MGLTACLVYSTLMWALAMAFPRFFIRLFNNDPMLVEFGAGALRIYMAAVMLMGAQMACQQTFIALGNAKCALFLGLLRKIILLIPLIYILPALLPGDKTTAVFLAEPVADGIAIATTVTLFFFQFKKAMNALEEEKKGL